MESLFAINNPNFPFPSFSVQHLLECDNTNYGCDGGWMADAYLWTIDHGVIATSDYPHAYKAAKPAKCAKPISTARFFNKHSNEEDYTTNDFLKSVLAQQPVGAAYHSDLSCMNFYKSGIIMPDQCKCSDPDL